ncbi:cupin domain-containing protein [Pseudomonas fragi]|uniref:Gentisate 1,2-dioxygenase n=1 Tax=Pseudomonas fragi TaxID=296 RepID=A0A449IKR0_PSEFR|nr:cupin domain-containing protein [Pseudomonas fragi]VFB19985.1 gentisate 1,2-dioxygenase [Pseudomonas fragi]
MTPLSASAAPQGYFEQLAEQGLSPGWAKKKPQMWPQPRPRYVPAVWRYADARAALDQACEFVSPEQAERRNLIMVNPVPDNLYPTCQNLVAAYQLVLPGETARSHRHSPNALRLILDAGGETFTIVNGVKIDVAEGDVVLTPSWHWHGHSNFGNEPAFWIDFLDVPLVQNLDCMFFEDHPSRNEQPTAHAPDSPMRNKGTDISARLRTDGSLPIESSALNTIGLHGVGLKQGERLSYEKRVENNIYAVTAGDVRMNVEGLGVVDLCRGDVIVVPTWNAYSIEGRSAWAQLIRVTDEPVMRALGFVDVTRL